MDNVVVLISDPTRPAIDAETVALAAKSITDGGGVCRAPIWLAEHVAPATPRMRGRSRPHSDSAGAANR